MSRQPGLLIIRFSAMGDVAMTAPVLKELNSHYPDVKLTVVSRTLFAPFFEGIPNLNFYAFDPKGKHKGFLGLIRLFMELRQFQVTAVADLHNNLRSRIIGILFFLCGIKTIRVDKARAEKKKLTRRKEKIMQPLLPMTERYAAVFSALGFPFVLKNKLHPLQPETLSNELNLLTGLHENRKWVGISPFAQHLQKVYPLDKMEKVILKLAAEGYLLFIFGGGEEEKNIAKKWEDQHQNIRSVIGKVNLTQELKLISNLDLMLSMDSSGMHLASLKGVPVVSIWGATHPYTGFLGYGQSIDDALQIELYCRPCSVYGNVPCYRGDLACMNNLSETVVINKVISKLNYG
ncbi:glycosyltransferase family 9 protein [Pedobacter sp. L105]|uniref:glycosyltransferase family 9 protein n=1 Tax=Pedobacter sp. L105 TaxID=1641871 RepID=UPI00131E0D85|nr:glycosyltransferase family 9 protein [Pedobacter sp. L105]